MFFLISFSGAYLLKRLSFFWGGYLGLLRKICEERNQKDTEMTPVRNHTRDSSREKVGV